MQRQFPIRRLPQKAQSIAERMRKADSFNIDYLATAMLCAAATAIGNSQSVRIKGTWRTSPMFYMALVGRPGAGKTPPLEKAFAPIRAFDRDAALRFEQEIAAYNALAKHAQAKQKKPVPRLRIVNDSTPEATISAHSRQHRGISVISDEVMGFFNSVNRYNNGQFVEQLLSAWSGSPIMVTRKTNDEILSIDKPNINIAGTIQTKRCAELLCDKYEKIGFLDRMLFCYPESITIDEWNVHDSDAASDNGAAEEWHAILRTLNAQPSFAVAREFNEEAKNTLYQWWNDIVRDVNSCDDESLISSRQMKRPIMVSRIALTLQALQDAFEGKAFDRPVSRWAVKSAIEISNYFEACFEALKQAVAELTAGRAQADPQCKPYIQLALDDMQQEFSFSDYRAAYERFAGNSASAGVGLKRLVTIGAIVKIARGMYAKL